MRVLHHRRMVGVVRCRHVQERLGRAAQLLDVRGAMIRYPHCRRCHCRCCHGRDGASRRPRPRHFSFPFSQVSSIIWSWLTRGVSSSGRMYRFCRVCPPRTVPTRVVEVEPDDFPMAVLLLSLVPFVLLIVVTRHTRCLQEVTETRRELGIRTWTVTEKAVRAGCGVRGGKFTVSKVTWSPNGL